jgi:hypothetical protein
MEVLILLAVLACPIAMGTMMLLMWRGMRSGHGAGGGAREDVGSAQNVKTGDREEAAGS